MNIQKVKEALEAAKAELPELSSAPNGKEPQAIRAARLVGEAIAELEKPADDYDISEAASDIFSNADSWFIGYNKIKQIIQKCAESYRAKKCAECTQKKAPYKLFGVD